jgi:hypothetical protein
MNIFQLSFEYPAFNHANDRSRDLLQHSLNRLRHVWITVQYVRMDTRRQRATTKPLDTAPAYNANLIFQSNSFPPVRTVPVNEASHQTHLVERVLGPHDQSPQ